MILKLQYWRVCKTWGNFVKYLHFVNNYLIKFESKNLFTNNYLKHYDCEYYRTTHLVSTESIFSQIKDFPFQYCLFYLAFLKETQESAFEKGKNPFDFSQNYAVSVSVWKCLCFFLFVCLGFFCFVLFFKGAKTRRLFSLKNFRLNNSFIPIAKKFRFIRHQSLHSW